METYSCFRSPQAPSGKLLPHWEEEQVLCSFAPDVPLQ